MVDFLMISTRANKGQIEIYPKFIIRKSSDLMVRGGDFYAIWIEELGLWSTDENDALALIDKELDRYAKENKERFPEGVRVLHMWDSENRLIQRWHQFVQKDMRDNFHMLDEKIIFSNTELTKKDYASKKLTYPLEEGSIESYDRLMSVLYSPEERHKIEWAIGSIVNGDSKKIQKFIVLYGAAGTGKSTVLNIIQDLFDGYYAVFDAKALGSAMAQFALEPFKMNPLIGIQHDGDLSKIEDNTRLNSLVSHETMSVNEKHKNLYSNKFKAFLFLGTNRPVKITDAKSGLLRRLIDVTPTGEKVGVREYKSLVKKISFELGAIAWHCKQVYEADPGFYDHYIPVNMMAASNDFYNFIEDSYYEFGDAEEVSLKTAWSMYKKYCEEANVGYPFSQRIFKEELKNYFEEFDGKTYKLFKKNIFKKNNIKENNNLYKIELLNQPSILDDICANLPAQYATDDKPQKAWRWVKTTLKDIDTSQTHYLKLPPEHIVLDFDFKNEKGEKDLERNIEEASKFPPTYAETSKSGGGLHLHYIYTGNPEELENKYSENIEIKISKGNASLRRKLTLCNALAIAKIGSGLPLKKKKGEKLDIEKKKIGSVEKLREQIERNLNKEIHPGTKPSIDFIKKILDDAYDSDLTYDISDLRERVMDFAKNSTNHKDYCKKLVKDMKFISKDLMDEIVFLDIEIYPNFFGIAWKIHGKKNPVIKMYNPSAEQVERLLLFKLGGHNIRKYDIHILWAASHGYTVRQLFILSQRIIVDKDSNAWFKEAFGIPYVDTLDYPTVSQGLKKWEIQLEMKHDELPYAWDQPIPEELWPRVMEYCGNDVLASEAVFDATQDDFAVRKIIATLSGLKIIDPNRLHIIKILVGDDKNPDLVYTDLATGKQYIKGKYIGTSEKNCFPGYEYVVDENGTPHNMYRGTDVGFGGYVYAVPGMYVNVDLFDVGNMHGASILELNKFGDKTVNYAELREDRMVIKHCLKTGDFTEAKKIHGGIYAPYLTDEESADKLQNAIKLILNSTYGIAAATFNNPLRDPDDKNNIIALRGALFMRTLQDEIEARGFKVIHIKTDSIKIANTTPELRDFIFEFGKKYGYEFEHEARYDRMCLVNDAVYIAKYDSEGVRNKGGKHANEWVAVGTQFQVPYVLKSLFKGEEITFDDCCEMKSVTQGEIYLDMNEDIGEDEHNYIFVGKVGLFTPVKEGCGGGILYRRKDGKDYAVTGTKDDNGVPYRWMESEMVKDISMVDTSYYERLCDKAVETINKFGSYTDFISDDFKPDNFVDFMNPPTGDPDEVPFEGSHIVEKK